MNGKKSVGGLYVCYGFSTKNQPLVLRHWASASSVNPRLRGLKEVSEYWTSATRISLQACKSCSKSPSDTPGFAQYKSGTQDDSNSRKKGIFLCSDCNRWSVIKSLEVEPEDSFRKILEASRVVLNTPKNEKYLRRGGENLGKVMDNLSGGRGE